MSYKTKYIFLSGDGSGAGKTSIAMGILDSLLHSGMKPSELAYIKPCTQCEAVQLLWKYCYSKQIEFISYNAPIIYYSGYTHDVLANSTELSQSDRTVESRRNKVKHAITELATGTAQSHTDTNIEHKSNDIQPTVKKYVVVDGVGYPAVGSCVGLSNADVANLVSAPIILVGKSGVGNAIDSMNYIRTYFLYNKCTVLGTIFNKIEDTGYHKIEDTIKYTRLYYEQNVPEFNIYGYIPKQDKVTDNNDKNVVVGETGAACRRKMANKSELELTDVENTNMNNWLKLFAEKVDFKLLLQDVDRYWDKHYANSK